VIKSATDRDVVNFKIMWNIRRMLGKRMAILLVTVGLVLYLIDTIILPLILHRTVPTRIQERGKNQDEYTDKHGIRVIVGHYKGDLGSNVNYTKQELNQNRYSPVSGAGEMGKPVHLKAHQQILSKRLWGLNQFNLVVSDSISVDRQLDDVRSAECSEVTYTESTLPHTSVIIVFHNEAWSTLVRTVHSVINTSPSSLIKEIILVDDASDRDYLGLELKDHLDSLAVPVHILRTSTRIGLIKARLMGAQHAKGDVLTFLDAHCECTPGWLQPLLHAIKQNNASVVCPVIDILDDETFQYTKSFSLHWGAFNWALHFRWFTLGSRLIQQRRQNVTVPYGTPVMAGGLFSVAAKYFWSVGSYDQGMDIWGGENLEMSFRVWQCGGRVEIAPCSRVGHVFRKASPYSFPRDGGVNSVLYGNLARVAMVWMDEYADFYFKIDKKAAEASANQNVTSRINLRKEMQCNSFDWYLDTVWPESFFPRRGQFFGKIKSKAVAENCLNMPRARPGVGRAGTQQPGPAVLYPCLDDRFHADQHFTHSKNGYIMGDESMCLDCPNWDNDSAPGVRFSSCQELDRQLWDLLPSEGTSAGWKLNFGKEEKISKIMHRLSGKCLTVSRGGTSDTMILTKCDNSDFSFWYFVKYSW